MNKNRNLKMNLQTFASGDPVPVTTPEAGLTTGDGAFAQVNPREIDFVTQFTENWKTWMRIMGIMKPVAKEPNTTLTTYKAVVDGEKPAQVKAGERVALTKFKIVADRHRLMDVKKFRKAVPVEDAIKYGSEVAVDKTDRAFRNMLFRDTLKEFYAFIQTGTLAGVRKTWQRAISSALYGLRNYLEGQDVDCNNIVGFANLMDYEAYVGEKDITTQTFNGMQYIQNFMGFDTLWLLPDNYIPRGKVIATPVENVIMYYTDPESSAIKALGLDFTTDPELGLIGFHANGDYTTFTGESQAIKDIVLWADRIDAICVVEVSTTKTEKEPAVAV